MVFEYDDAGRRVSMTDGTAGTTSWTWFGVGGVESVSRSDIGATVGYDYDEAGRRIVMDAELQAGTFADALAGDAAHGGVYRWETDYNYDRYGRMEIVADGRVADPAAPNGFFQYVYRPDASRIETLAFPGGGAYRKDEIDSLGRVLTTGMYDTSDDLEIAVHSYGTMQRHG